MDGRPQQDATILVVEDDLGIRTMLELALPAAGYAVRSASSSRQGYEVLAHQHIDLVLLDRHLAGEAGARMVPALERRNVPVVMMSADDRGMYERSGAAWLQKPFTLEELYAAVERGLQRAD
jgi:two-component system phosphate regulon response regulator OmpR